MQIGAEYSLQLIFWAAEDAAEWAEDDGILHHTFNILTNGAVIAQRFDPAAMQGGTAAMHSGACVQHRFTATNATLTIRLQAACPSGPQCNNILLNRMNPHIAAFTLEKQQSRGVASVGAVSGAAEGQGLDMSGDFVYAIDFAGLGGMQIGDAVFTPSATTDGLSVRARQEWAPGQIEVQNHRELRNGQPFGQGPHDAALEQLLDSSIYTDAVFMGCGGICGFQPLFFFNLTGIPVGIECQLQLIFWSAEEESMAIWINGQPASQYFNPALIQGGAAALHSGAVFRYIFTPDSPNLAIEIRKDFSSCMIPNDSGQAVLTQGLTQDEWDSYWTDHGRLSPPTHGCYGGPRFRSDIVSISGLTLKATATLQSSSGAFSGARAGQGLDMNGNFVYAIDFGGPGGMQIGDAVFTSGGDPYSMVSGEVLGDHTEGATIRDSEWYHHTPGFMNQLTQIGTVDYRGGELFGHGQQDASLAQLMNTQYHIDANHVTEIRVLCGPTVCGRKSLSTIVLERIIVGIQYQLQLIFWSVEQEDTMDISLNGELVAERFSPASLQGGAAARHSGAVFTCLFTATSPTLRIELLKDFTAMRCVFDPDRQQFMRYADGSDWDPNDGTALSVSALTLERDVSQGRSTVPTGMVEPQALKLVDDATLVLPAMVLGDALACSAWIKLGTMWDGQTGFTLFSSFQSDA
jgi:hypothetical protein